MQSNRVIRRMGQMFSWIKRRVMNEDELFEFPKTLKELGYQFNEAGQLRSIEGDEPFNFDVRENDYNYNQQHYEALGDAVTDEVNAIMEKKYKLQRTYLPIDAEPSETKSYLYISGDLYTNNDKLMILIHGSGAVRAGQWSRRLIINDDLDKGSQLPYIKWARENNYSLIVANPNLNFVDETKKKPVPIRGNGSPEEHVESVWREFVQRSPVRNIVIIAHSYGGVCAAALCSKHIREFEERVFAVVLTDSVHGLRQKPADQEMVDFFKKRAMNWASAYDPLDAPLHTPRSQCPTISAGTDVHELTSYTSMGSIFKYIPKKYDQKVNPEKYEREQEEARKAEEQRLAEEQKDADADADKKPDGVLITLADETQKTGDQATGQLANQMADTHISQNPAEDSEAVNKKIEQAIDSNKWEKFGVDEHTENPAKVNIVDESEKKTDNGKEEL